MFNQSFKEALLTQTTVMAKHGKTILFCASLFACLLAPQGQFVLAQQVFTGYTVSESNYQALPTNNIESEPAQITDKTAILSLETDQASYRVGDYFVVRVMLDPGGNPVNLVNSDITYSTSTLKLVSIDYTRSAFSIFLNTEFSEGQVITTTLQPTPGITERAESAELIFRVIDQGEATLSFNETTQTLANDGFGTDIFSHADDLNLSTTF
jgi:hypothetical protein